MPFSRLQRLRRGRSKKRGPSKKPNPGRKKIRLLLIGIMAAFLLYQLATWPRVPRLATENPSTTAFMERYQDQQKREKKDPNLAWQWTPYNQISDHLKLAVVVSEDIDFFSHGGFATAEIKTSLRQAVEDRKRPRGASTLTQQTVKNLWLSPSRNPWRKVKEALLTLQVERRIPKHRILEIYLNIVEFGPGVYGIEAAARKYFGVSAAHLNQTQSARLATSLPSPRRWNPHMNSSVASKRAQRTRRIMDASDWVRNQL